MPTFIRPAPAALADFQIRCTVFDDGVTQTVSLAYAVTVNGADGAPLDRHAGDLAPFLTPTQVTNFTNVALALYGKAKTELLT